MKMITTQTCCLTALAALMLCAPACIVVDGDGESDASSESAGSGGSSSSGGGAESTGSSTGGGSTGGSTGSGGNVDNGNGPGPSQDLAPEAQDPGEHVCAGCPEAVIDLTDADAGMETIFDIDGTVNGQVGHGKFLVLNEQGQFSGGGLLVDDSSGDFAQTVPLFCGVNLVKIYFENDAGRSTFVRRVERKACIAADVRVTVAWDETTRHWGTHLVRFGGSLGDSYTDCKDKATCYPDSNYTDWGIEGSNADDPVQDISMNYTEMGVENIYYPSAEDGLTVLIDNKDDFGAMAPNGTLYINVHDQPTAVRQLEGFQPKHVFTAAEIDGAAGTMTWIEDDYDCSAEWDSGACQAALP